MLKHVKKGVILLSGVLYLFKTLTGIKIPVKNEGIRRNKLHFWKEHVEKLAKCESQTFYIFLTKIILKNLPRADSCFESNFSSFRDYRSPRVDAEKLASHKVVFYSLAVIFGHDSEKVKAKVGKENWSFLTLLHWLEAILERANRSFLRRKY